MESFKRVACLYRASTKMQVQKEDLPMQKRACNEFIASKPGWVLIKEYTELAVSGYHVASEDRDILQDMREDAGQLKFDVLLVFMFDRLGRREDETPFIVEWLVERGIEVWSVQEGRQEIKDSTDKLINYLRYWTAGGESEKTSIRVAQKQIDMIKDGIYRGGPAPYGYDLVWSGVKNRDGRELKKIVICQDEAKWVQRIFDLCVNEDMGSSRIAVFLQNNGVLTRKGKQWDAGRVRKLLNNPLYKGYFVIGKTKTMRDGKEYLPADEWIYSRHMDELAIVSEDLWDNANEMIANRNTKRLGPSNNLPPPKYQPLFKNLLYCGYCHTKMGVGQCKGKRVVTSSGEEQFPNTYRYVCYRKSRKAACDGRIGIGCKKVDTLIINEINSYLSMMQSFDLRGAVKHKKDASIKALQDQVSKLDKEISYQNKILVGLFDEIGKFVTGSSLFTGEALKAQKEAAENSRNQLIYEKQKLDREIKKLLRRFAFIKKLNDIVPCWEDIFQRADIEKKKELLGFLIDKVYLYSDVVEIEYMLSADLVQSIVG